MQERKQEYQHLTHANQFEDIPFIGVQIELFSATGRPKGRMLQEFIQVTVELLAWRKRESAVMFEDVCRTEKP